MALWVFQLLGQFLSVWYVFFKFLFMFCFWDILGSAQGLLLTHHSGISPGNIWGIIRDAGDQTFIGHKQGKYFICSAITPAPFFVVFLLGVTSSGTRDLLLDLSSLLVCSEDSMNYQRWNLGQLGSRQSALLYVHLSLWPSVEVSFAVQKLVILNIIRFFSIWEHNW